jgi:8-oxo-dGTP diphosphatase
VPFPYPRELADEWIASTAPRIAAGEAYDLAVTRGAGAAEELLGCIGLTLRRQTGEAELGYWIARRFWGQGLAPEAAAGLLRWALGQPGITGFRASALEENARSAQVLRRLGFRERGQGMQEFLSRGGPMPVRLFSASREELAAALTPAIPAAPLPLLLVAAVALVDADGRVLLAQRPADKAMAGLWEFPGGKLEPGEAPEAALIRELREELGIDVAASCLAPFTFASHAYAKFHLLMPLYLCRRWTGAVAAREGQALAWVRPAKLADYPMPPADVPLVAMLRDFL